MGHTAVVPPGLSLHGAPSHGTYQRRRNHHSAGAPRLQASHQLQRMQLTQDDKSHQENSWEAGDQEFQRPASLSRERSVQGTPLGKNELHPLLSLRILLFKVQDPAWVASHPFVRRGPGTRFHFDQLCPGEEVRRNQRKGGSGRREGY